MQSIIMVFGIVELIMGNTFVLILDNSSNIVTKNARKRYILITFLLFILFVTLIIIWIRTNNSMYSILSGLLFFLLVLANIINTALSIKDHIIKKLFNYVIDLAIILLFQIFALIIFFTAQFDLNRDLFIDSFALTNLIYYNQLVIYIGIGLFTLNLYLIARLYYVALTKIEWKRSVIEYYIAFTIGIFVAIFYISFIDFDSMGLANINIFNQFNNAIQLFFGSTFIPIVLILIQNHRNHSKRNNFIIVKNANFSNDKLDIIKRYIVSNKFEVESALNHLSKSSISCEVYSKEDYIIIDTNNKKIKLEK